VQLEALRRQVDPADPFRAVVGTAQPRLPARQAARHIVGTPRDLREVLAALRVELHVRGEPVERRGKRRERFGESRTLRHRVLRELPGRFSGGEAQLAHRGHDIRSRIRQFRHVARRRARGHLGVARQIGELPARHLLAEEQRRRARQLVRLVEDHSVAVGEELGEAFVAQHHVGEEQVVVHDHDVGVERFLARFHDEAFAVDGQSEPRQVLRVDVTSGQIVAFSGTSASSPRSPRSLACANCTMRAR
jgi:hypothetical protein